MACLPHKAYRNFELIASLTAEAKSGLHHCIDTQNPNRLLIIIMADCDVLEGSTVNVGSLAISTFLPLMASAGRQSCSSPDHHEGENFPKTGSSPPAFGASQATLFPRITCRGADRVCIRTGSCLSDSGGSTSRSIANDGEPRPASCRNLGHPGRNWPTKDDETWWQGPPQPSRLFPIDNLTHFVFNSRTRRVCWRVRHFTRS
jgi:hypothetical protein